MLRKLTTLGLSILLAAVAGCQSHADNKAAARQRWDKTSANIKLALAQQQYDNGKYEEATKLVKECIAANPEIAEAHLLFGKLMLAEGSTENAVRQLQQTVELDSGLSEGWYWLGVAAQQEREYLRARDFYDRALTLDPTNVDYVLAVADVEVGLDNTARALQLLQHKMDLLPHDVSLRTTAAELMLRMGKDDAAIKLYRQALLMTADNDDIAEALGYCYVFSGKWGEAAEIFENLLDKQSEADGSQLYLQLAALCNMNSGRYDKALTYYGRLSINDRDNAELWVNMGQAALGAAMPERAIECGKQALALQAGRLDATALIACAQYAQGRYALAASNFDKVAVDESKRGFSLLMKARCDERLGRFEQARLAYEQASKLPAGELAELLTRDGLNR